MKKSKPASENATFPRWLFSFLEESGKQCPWIAIWLPALLVEGIPQAPLEHRFSICGCAFLRTLLAIASSLLDAALCAEISKSRDEVKRCVECGAVFTPKYNRAKYSPDCAARGRRKKEAERQRQRYLQATQLSS